MTQRTEPSSVVDPGVIDSIDRRLVVARQRRLDYDAAGDWRSVEIEGGVIDRLLRERFVETGQ